MGGIFLRHAAFSLCPSALRADTAGLLACVYGMMCTLSKYPVAKPAHAQAILGNLLSHASTAAQPSAPSFLSHALATLGVGDREATAMRTLAALHWAVQRVSISDLSLEPVCSTSSNEAHCVQDLPRAMEQGGLL